MKIYIGHSSAVDYKSDLYKPIRSSTLNDQHEFILPHEQTGEPTSSMEIIASCDLLIADISEKSTGLGIELGWANAQGVPIFCIYKEGSSFSPSIRTVTDKIAAYQDSASLVAAIATFVNVAA